MHYAKQVYGHEVTQKETMAIALDEEEGTKEFFLDCSTRRGCYSFSVPR